MLDKLSARCSRSPEIDRPDEMSVVFQIAAENRLHKFSRINPPLGRRQLRLFLGLKSNFRWTSPGRSS